MRLLLSLDAAAARALAIRPANPFKDARGGDRAAAKDQKSTPVVSGQCLHAGNQWRALCSRRQDGKGEVAA